MAIAILLIRFDVLDPGSAADWLAGIGAIFAAAAALSIATRDRADRREERDAASLAQMRLVRIESEPIDGDSSQIKYQLKIDIANHGDRAILQVSLLSATVESVSAGTFANTGATDPPVLAIVPTVRSGIPHPSLRTGMANGSGDSWNQMHKAEHRNKTATELRLKCTDADGQPWIVSNNGDPVHA
ncbi:hypothetical protein [Mycolicibacterium frederiksbergense]|uniref:hypothetical protein n=1 Tax=Mycolicibacterium frederiksbergense TaxID=117567 RepID=UPI00265C1F2B|nr:hypothetical protein [Mycolicibacterium frederiksbergense]MDO0976946.1 hypothetical protein [Mycolicibacterium frederiksbergense]